MATPVREQLFGGFMDDDLHKEVKAVDLEVKKVLEQKAKTIMIKYFNKPVVLMLSDGKRIEKTISKVWFTRAVKPKSYEPEWDLVIRANDGNTYSWNHDLLGIQW